MTRQVRALIVAGVVGFGGLLGSGATTAAAHDDGFPGFGPGFGPGIAVGEPYGYGGGYGYGRGYGGGYGYGGYRRGYGYGYGRGYGGGYGGYGDYSPGSYYYSSRTTVTTIIYCDRCGRYHDRYAPCGGRRFGGYFPGPYPW